MSDMYRNFVHPSSLDGEGIRSSIPETSVHVYSDPNQQAHHSNQPYISSGASNSYCHELPNGYGHVTSLDGCHGYSSGTGATIVQSNNSTQKGGGFTTSIFVNGGGSMKMNQKAVPKPYQNYPSQNAQNYPTNQTYTSNGQSSTYVFPPSPHPGIHSTHAYTPLHSANAGLASLSITEDDDEQEEPVSDNSESSHIYQNIGHISHNILSNTNRHIVPFGSGNSSGRPEVPYGSGHTHQPPSLYPIQDEQEEEDKASLNGETALADNTSTSGQTYPLNPSVPGQNYMQKTFNIIPSLQPVLEQIFVGRRDVRNPKTVTEKQIVSAKGTVRGFKNRVRAGIATFWDQPQDHRNYRTLEKGKIVIYASSMCVVRETTERCKRVRCLLQNHMIRYEERDLYMSREIQEELKHRLAQEGIGVVTLPHVFADGICIGGAEELERLNEAGELRALLDNYQKIVVRMMCDRCGGYRFIPCEFCHGSKRSLIRNHFTEEFCALRCMHCDENGLRRCEQCRDQQE